MNEFLEQSEKKKKKKLTFKKGGSTFKNGGSAFKKGNSEVDQIIQTLNGLHLDLHQKATRIQALVRGWLFRKNRLPLIFYLMQNFLSMELKLEDRNSKIDGRVTSAMDEDHVSDLLVARFGESRIWKPSVKKRMWYDIAVNVSGSGGDMANWMPCNIKITTTKTADNTGSLAMCAWAYTNHEMTIRANYPGTSSLAATFISKIKTGEYNPGNRDYYFLVVNKDNPQEIICNSVIGLSILTSNSHNLPYQVKWNLNSEYQEKDVSSAAELCLEAIEQTKPTWQESVKEYARNRTTVAI